MKRDSKKIFINQRHSFNEEVITAKKGRKAFEHLLSVCCSRPNTGIWANLVLVKRVVAARRNPEVVVFEYENLLFLEGETVFDGAFVGELEVFNESH